MTAYFKDGGFTGKGLEELSVVMNILYILRDHGLHRCVHLSKLKIYVFHCVHNYSIRFFNNEKKYEIDISAS